MTAGEKPPSGCNIDTNDSTFNELFPPIPDWAMLDDDEIQTFEDFKTMERYEVYDDLVANL